MAPERASALLFLGGELRGAAAARAAAAKTDWLLCADGGARHAIRLRLRPHYVVGDMDSLPRPLPRSWKGVTLLRDTDEQRSDLEKALALARRLGVKELIVAGALGGALDHQLINVAVLEASRFAVTLLHGGRAPLLGPRRHRLAFFPRARLSLPAPPPSPC